MRTHSKSAARLASLALSSALVLAWGCSDDGLGKRHPVSGTVTYKGASVEKGEISFVPEGEGRAATGTISGGSYKLSTLGENDGAMPGKYKVTVQSKDLDVSAAQEKTKALGSGVALPQDYISKAGRNAKSNVPAKYAIPDTSPLTAEVKPGSNSFNFELTD